MYSRLALLTRPVGQEPKGANAFDRYIVPTYLKRYNEQLKRVVTDRLRYYALDIDSLAKKTVNPTKDRTSSRFSQAANPPQSVAWKKAKPLSLERETE